MGRLTQLGSRQGKLAESCGNCYGASAKLASDTSSRDQWPTAGLGGERRRSPRTRLCARLPQVSHGGIATMWVYGDGVGGRAVMIAVLMLWAITIVYAGVIFGKLWRMR